MICNPLLLCEKEGVIHNPLLVCGRVGVAFAPVLVCERVRVACTVAGQVRESVDLAARD